ARASACWCSHEGKGECVLVLDRRATPEQRAALLRVLGGEDTEPAATIFQIFAITCDKSRAPSRAGRSPADGRRRRFDWKGCGLARVELDDEVRLHHHRIGHVGQCRRAEQLSRHLVVVDLDIVRQVALGTLRRFEHYAGVLGLVAHLDHVTLAAAIARDVDAPAIDPHMAVADELPGCEHGRNELGTIDDGIEPALEQPDQILAGVASEPRGLAVDRLELLLGDVAVVALQLLLGAKLLAVVGELPAAALAMLARSVFTLVVWALWPAPDILAEAAVDLMLRVYTFRHSKLQSR